MRLFVWISFVVDFFGVFFVISFAFYRPADPLTAIYFTNFRTVVLWEVIVCILPFAVIGSIGLHIYWTTKLSVEKTCSLCPCFFAGISMLWTIGMFITLMTMTISCCLWAALAVIGMSVSS